MERINQYKVDLEESRKQVIERCNRKAEIEEEDIKSIEKYFSDYKKWKEDDNKQLNLFSENKLPISILEGRMTIRENKEGSNGVTSVGSKYDTTKKGMDARKNPQNYLDNKKHDLGLYPLSAILFNPKDIKVKTLEEFVNLYKQQSFQGAELSSTTIFCSLPYPEDLKVLYELFRVHKDDKNKNFQILRKEMKASISRPDLGSDDDMMIHMKKLTRGKGSNKKETYKYGWTGNEEIDEKRREKAINYMNIHSEKLSVEGNNEITVKYREY